MFPPDLHGSASGRSRPGRDAPASGEDRPRPPALRFRLLGPLTGWRGPVEVRISSSKQRALLGLLLLGAGSPVPRRMIVEVLWGGEAPASTVNLVHTYVGRLRRTLDPGHVNRGHDSWLTRLGSAYAIRPEDCDLDLLRFRALVGAAGRAPAGEERLTLLLRALDLWHQPRLADLDDLLGGHPWVDRLEQEWITTVLAAAELAEPLQQAAKVLPYLRAAAVAEPLNEAVHARLVLALAAAGAKSSALGEYDRIRRRLADELGVDPGPQLSAAHLRVLRHRPAEPELGPSEPLGPLGPIGPLGPLGPIRPLGPAGPLGPLEPLGPLGPSPGPVPAGSGGAGRGRATPALLPADLPDFTGREELVDTVRASLTGREGHRLPPVVVLTGDGGVGKSALAVHVAHHLVPDFPDGQLYAEMTGADHRPIDPSTILIRMLRALGLGESEIPHDRHERAGLYRSILAGRRLLIVLDDLRDQDQLQPLLPGGPSCAVIGTTRAGRGHFPSREIVEVDRLDPADGLRLLGAVIGAERVAAEPGAAAEIVRLCDAMPLAIRVAAARLAGRRHWPLARMAGRLADPGRRLDELGLAGLDVRGGFARDYADLDGRARTAFRRLGLLQTPSFAVWLAAACCGLPPEETEDLVDQLTDRRLVRFAGTDPAGQNRYRIPPLATLFARERALQEDGAEAVRATVARAFDTLEARFRQALRVARAEVAAAGPGTGPAGAGPGAAGSWLRVEQPTIRAAAEQCRAQGDPDRAGVLDSLSRADPVRRQSEFTAGGQGGGT
jgi:DNA-binding SARP family transcriptional activator